MQNNVKVVSPWIIDQLRLSLFSYLILHLVSEYTIGLGLKDNGHAIQEI